LVVILYRGVSVDMHVRLLGLEPKLLGPFLHGFAWDGPSDSAFFYDTDVTYDRSIENAVIWHQFQQRGHPTAGISTTPVFARATCYALRGGARSCGIVYEIDAGACSRHVSVYRVSQFVMYPSVPQDDEHILVSNPPGALPFCMVRRIHVV
jgi:hypothetical protein